jgi:hypothetical protein
VQDPEPDTLVRGTVPRIRIRISDPYQNVTNPGHCFAPYSWNRKKVIITKFWALIIFSKKTL